MTDLNGRVAIVTGAGRGIGQTVARVLGERGMLVAVNDLDPALAESTAAELRSAGVEAWALPGDVSQKADAQMLIERTEAVLGPLWLLVNNAGVFNSGPTAELSEAAWDVVFDVDAKGVFLCSQAAIQRMMPRGGGRIVNLASIAGMIVRANQIAYCSAKAAVIHFSRCLAVEMAPYGITVNCLCPGMTWTEMLETSAAERGLNLNAMVEMIPAGRMAEETDHANLVSFLASDDAGHLTGQVIAVDGAQSLYHPLMKDSKSGRP